MKYRIQLKDLDGFYEGLSDAVNNSVAQIPGLSNAERESVAERRKDELAKFDSRWVEYGENITIEFDTEANTATVVELGK